MQLVLYLILGMLDVYAIFALIFKAFRFPYFEYIKEITVLAILTSIVSYFIRIYFSINPMVDILIHFLFYILFLWLVVKAKLWISFITSIMYFFYGFISGIVMLIYTGLHILDNHLIDDPNSYAVFLLQITQQLIAFLIAFGLYKFNLGIHRFTRPPHDFVTRRSFGKKELIIIYIVIVLAIATFSAYCVYYQYKNVLVFPIILVFSMSIFYMAYRRGKSRG
jgi:hypothetical protein